MGLLQKATDQNTNSPEIRRNSFQVIKKNLSELKNTIEFYPAVFKELVTLFSIEKGALLVKENGMFTLSSIIGLDFTTKNRLRMSEIEYEKFVANSDKKILQKYFSIREFVTIKDTIIVPFSNTGTTDALLLITEFKTEKYPTIDEMKSYIGELSEFLGANPFHRLQNIDDQSNNIKESITSYVQKIKNSQNRIIFLKLNLSNLLKTFKETDSLSTSSSIKNSAVKILTSFSKNRGRVFQLYNNDILLTLLDKKETTNIIVVQQQIGAAFKSIFSNKLDSVDLNYESLIWKNNSLDTILDHFIQDESIR
ncbi:MAG: hypothetical protein OCD02_13080 [Spirochaetaceae bacterium]